MQQDFPKVKWYQSISAKLFLVISAFLVVTVGAISGQNSREFNGFLMRRIEDSAISEARQGAGAVSAMADATAKQLALVMHGIGADKSAGEIQQMAATYVAASRENVAFHLVRQVGSKRESVAFAFTARPEPTRFENQRPEQVQARLKKDDLELVAKFGTKQPAVLKIVNRSATLKIPLISFAYPFKIEGQPGRTWAILTIWLDRLVASLPGGKYLSGSLVDRQGRNVATRARSGLVQGRTSLPPSFVGRATSGREPFGSAYLGRPGAQTLAAFYAVEGQPLAVTVEEDTKVALEAARTIIIKTAAWAWILLLVGILISYLVASSLTKNLKLVTEATRHIARGNFATRIQRVGKDEVGVVGAAVNDMAAQIQNLLDQEIEKVRLQNEVLTAKTVQETFFPKEEIDRGHLQIVGLSRPASECGGDWWGHFPVGEHRDFVFIGDATGHGVSSALITAMIYACCNAIGNGIDANTTPSAILKQINQIFHRAGRGGTTMTLLAMLFDARAGTLTCASAGHNFPYLIPADPMDGRIKKNLQVAPEEVRRFQRLMPRGALLGFSPNSNFKDMTVEVRPKDKVVLYTDGLIECAGRDGQPLGIRFLEKAIYASSRTRAKQLTTGIMDHALAHLDHARIDDDMTFVTIEATKAWAKTEEQAA